MFLYIIICKEYCKLYWSFIFQNVFLAGVQFKFYLIFSDYYQILTKIWVLDWGCIKILNGWNSIQEWGSNNANTVDGCWTHAITAQ